MKSLSQDKITDDAMFSKIYDIVSNSNGVIVCTVKKQYGAGRITFIEIAKEVFVVYSDYCIGKIDDFKDTSFSQDIISIYQVLEGHVITQINEKKSIIVKQGDMVICAGNMQVMNSNGYNKRVDSIGVFGYSSGVINLLKSLGAKSELVLDYQEEMKKLGKVLACRSDYKFNKLFSELKESVSEGKWLGIKLKALELLYHGLNGYKDCQCEERKQYDSYYIEKVYEIKQFLEENWNKKIRLDQISEIYKINKTYVKEIFKAYFDMSPHQFVVKLRLEKSIELLEQKEMKIIEIAELTGFSSSSRYSECFKKNYGCLPSKYRQRI